MRLSSWPNGYPITRNRSDLNRGESPIAPAALPVAISARCNPQSVTIPVAVPGRSIFRPGPTAVPVVVTARSVSDTIPFAVSTRSMTSDALHFDASTPRDWHSYRFTCLLTCRPLPLSLFKLTCRTYAVSVSPHTPTRPEDQTSGRPVYGAVMFAMLSSRQTLARSDPERR